MTPKMSSAGTGVLDVVLDGKTIFSHQAEQRMPNRGEIVKLIQASATTHRVRSLPIGKGDGDDS